MLVSTVIVVAAGTLLVVFRNALANRLLGSDAADVVATEPELLPAAALAVLGAYVFVVGAATAIAEAVVARHGEPLWDHGKAIIEGAIFSVAGIGLFLGARGLASVWRRARPMVDSAPG